MDTIELIAILSGFVIGIGAVKYYFARLMNILKELVELFEAVTTAMADEKLTKQELEKIIKEAKDVLPAVKKLFDKKER